jgi:hypothetical protein
MASAVGNHTIIQQLTSGDAAPVLVADFQAWSSAPRLSRLLGDRADGHAVYQIDPISVLSGDKLYRPLPELAAACVEEFRASGPPPGGGIFVAGHCSASALSLHVSALLRDSYDVTSILVGPAWPSEQGVRNRFAETLRNLGVPDRPCPDLDGEPAAAVARMERALREEIIAVATSWGADGAADAVTELLAWYRGWLAFLLACHRDPAKAWTPAGTMVVLCAPDERRAVPGLSPDAYQLREVPALSEDSPITPELAESVLAYIVGS